MPIDWTTRERALSLAYLVEASYHDENGVGRMVHWCGPKARVGSGLSVPVPFYPGERKTFTPVWEARLTRASMDLNLGNIDQTIGAISDMSFNVDMSGGSQAPAPVPGDLLRDVVFGRWRNKPCRVWILDLDTGDTQMVGKGTFDKNPSSIGANNFQVIVDIDPIFPPTMSWPQGEIPMDGDSYTFNDPPGQGNFYTPTQFMLNPDHMGKFLGLNFGNALIASSFSTPATEDYVWREVVPYGRRVTGFSDPSHYIYAWVSPQLNCYVHDLFYKNSTPSDIISPLANPSSLVTFENTDPTRGPIGTCVRFEAASDPTLSQFLWFNEAYKSKVSARVSGPVTGQVSSHEADFIGGGSVPIYTSGGAPRSAVWSIISDVISEPSLMGLSDILGASAIIDFSSTVPTVADPIPYANMACVVPLEITDKPIPAREGFGELARFFPFDFVQRYDAVTEDWRVYPVWRTSFLTEPRFIFSVADMSRTDPPAITQYNNSDGKYANRVIVSESEHRGKPQTWVPGATPTAQEIDLFPARDRGYQHNDQFEQAATRESAVVTANLKMKHWLHYGDKGNSSAAWALGEERSQSQRTVQSTHGVRSYRVAMGDPIKYDIVGINSDVGMVRKMRYDFDLQQVQITSLHIDHNTSRSAQKGNDPKDNKSEGHSDPEG